MIYKDRNIVNFQLGMFFFANAHIHSLILNFHVLGFTFLKDIKNLFLLGIMAIANMWGHDFFVHDIPENIKMYVILYSGIL